MNDKLWGIWVRAKTIGTPLTLDQVRRMIMIDVARSKLYPPGWQDDSVNPPQWYIDELREKGILDQILKGIDEVGKK
jgi:hypothetical protein